MPRQRKIMVVDDDQEILELIEGLLEEQYDVETYRSATFALRNAPKSKPHAILMDLNMPETDGLEACRLLQEYHLTQHIPVIVVSAMAFEDHKNEFADLHVVDFISKPVDAKALFESIALHALPLDDAAETSP